MGREGKLRQKKSTLGEHLALLSVKYSMYPNEVFQALISARKNDKAVCGDLTVEYRGKVKNRTIFLITKDNHVVAQFRVDDEFLLRKDNPFESWMSTDKIRKKMAKQNTESIYTQINDLRAGMKRVNVKAAVLEMPKPAQVHTQFGNTVMVVNAVVRDETGKIRLCLWEGQIGSIGMGDNIELKNAQVCVFRGEKQLRLGKNGALTVLQSAAQHVKPQLATPSIR
jgi:replication factor A1